MLPPGAPHPAFRAPGRVYAPVARRLLFISQWLDTKGTRYLAEAFTALVRQGHDLTLVCAGTRQPDDVVRASPHALRLEDDHVHAARDQLERKGCLAAGRISAIRGALSSAEKASGPARTQTLAGITSQLDADAKGSCDASKVGKLKDAISQLGTAIVP